MHFVASAVLDQKQWLAHDLRQCIHLNGISSFLEPIPRAALRGNIYHDHVVTLDEDHPPM